MEAGIKLKEVTLTGKVYDCRFPLSPLTAIRVLLRMENLILVRMVIGIAEKQGKEDFNTLYATVWGCLVC